MNNKSSKSEAGQESTVQQERARERDCRSGDKQSRSKLVYREREVDARLWTKGRSRLTQAFAASNLIRLKRGSGGGEPGDPINRSQPEKEKEGERITRGRLVKEAS